MELPYYIENGRKREAKWVECRNCGIGFLKRTDWIKKDGNNFCSRKCSSTFRKKRIELNCSYCNKKIYRTPSDIRSSKTGYFFCSWECKDKAQKIDNGFGDLWLPHYKDGSWEYRRRAFDNYEHKCYVCGYNEIIGILEVHHLDCDKSNNNLDNLMILCPNCHRCITLKYAHFDENKNFILGE